MRRQIALSVEAECKLSSIRASPREEQSNYIDEDTQQWDFQEVNRTDLRKIARELQKVNPVRHQRLADKIFGGQQSRFFRASFHLKKFSDEAAHPTTLDGKPVTWEVARQLIASMDLRDAKPAKRVYEPDNLDGMRTEAIRLVNLLVDFRRGEKTLLDNYV